MGEVRIRVRVKPGNSRTQVGGRYGDTDQLVVAVNAPPVDGAANDSVVKAVAKALGIKARQVRIVSGQASRSKVVAVDVPESQIGAVRETIDRLLG